MDGMARSHPDLTARPRSDAVAPGDLGVGVGVVVPYDFVLDRELWRWTPEDVNLHLTRTPFEDVEVSVAQAVAVGDRAVVARATRDVMTAVPAVVAYGCTSGSFVGGRSGELALARAMVGAGAPRAVTTSGALLEAVNSLGLHSLAVVTPYDSEVGELLESFLAESDVEVVATGNMGLTGRIWTVPYEATADLVRRTVRPGADGVFISCTNLRTFDVIAPLERELGMPVLTANQVTMWAAVAAAGSRARGEAQKLLATLPT
jgi:maleate isomerase